MHTTRPPRLARGLALLPIALTLAAASPVAAQGAGAPPADPEVARAVGDLAACSEAVERKKPGEAVEPGRRAEAAFRARVRRTPDDVEAIVGLARTITQCLLPSADFMGQGEMSAEAIELLDRALEIDPRHWTARFVQASIHYRSPAFLGRTPRAARELDELLRQQGDRNDVPRFARTFEMRGAIWNRAGRTDSALAVWRRGAALFPADSALRALVEKLGTAMPKPSGDAGRGASGEGRGASERTESPLPIAHSQGPVPIQSVHVVATRTPPPPAQPSVRAVSRSQVLMTAGGSADVLQAVQMQPGATRVTEGSDVYTRGGDPSETSLLVDGGRMLSLSRFEGLNGGMFGAIDPFVVRSVRYSSGGFSVRHGNALSGVLEIETDGRPRETALRAGLSLVQASGTARAAMGKKVGGWVSGRVSHTGALLSTHGRAAEFDGAPHSQEMIASLSAAPSPTSEVRATAIVERDDSRRIIGTAGWEGPFRSSNEGRALLLSSRWMPGAAPVVVRTSLAASSRSGDWTFGVLSRERDEAALVARADAEWEASAGGTLAATLRAGVERGGFRRGESGTVPTTPVVSPGSPLRALDDEASRARHVGGYAEAELARGATAVVLGLRADRLPGETEATFDPRVALTTRRGEWTARVSAGLFHQGRWRASPAIPNAGTPSGAPGSARHLVAGVEREGATTTIRAEAFAKSYGDWAALGAGPRIVAGDARGIDLIAQRTGAGRLTGWIGWSLIDAEVETADGRRARSPYDVTHSATASATLALGRSWSVGSTVRYGTGAPFTPVVGARDADEGRAEPVYGALMGERLADYARVDARLMRFVRLPGALVTSFVEVINVADRANVASVAYDADWRARRDVHSFFASRTFVLGAEVAF